MTSTTILKPTFNNISMIWSKLQFFFVREGFIIEYDVIKRNEPRGYPDHYNDNGPSDYRDLKTLENDFEEFRTFLNDSYNRNDFYVKDVAGAVLLLVDELALKKHFETLPAILGEMWQALGDSGEAIRKSLLWIIETVVIRIPQNNDFSTYLFVCRSKARIGKLSN